MYDIEKLIPHRGAMKLIGEIIEMDEEPVRDRLDRVAELAPVRGRLR